MSDSMREDEGTSKADAREGDRTPGAGSDRARSRTRTAEYDGACAIVLDHLAETFGADSIPVSVFRPTCEEARAVGQYDGGAPTVLSRREYRDAWIGSTELLNVRTGRTETGTLHSLEARSGESGGGPS